MSKHFIFLRLSFVFLAVVVSATTIKPVPAQAGILEFFFPSLRTEENLYETLQAPFADVPEGEEQKKYTTNEEVMAVRLPENAVPLEKPHRQNAKISEYVGKMVSEAMTYSSDDYKQDMSTILELFDTQGKTQYQTFLQEKNIQKVLDSGRYHIRGFMLDAPLLLNSGPVGGRYRWLYEVPVMVSYMDRSAKDYKEADVTNQKIVVTLQVGRRTDIENLTGIVIETWSGKVQKIDKKG